MMCRPFILNASSKPSLRTSLPSLSLLGSIYLALAGLARSLIRRPLSVLVMEFVDPARGVVVGLSLPPTTKCYHHCTSWTSTYSPDCAPFRSHRQPCLPLALSAECDQTTSTVPDDVDAPATYICLDITHILAHHPSTPLLPRSSLSAAYCRLQNLGSSSPSHLSHSRQITLVSQDAIFTLFKKAPASSTIYNASISSPLTLAR
ncbi:hypothetical protein LMH87_009696 [Akanthomyces muscarius]|uniref:Uncharacterized protein n=1 Tax=Akanthomyces muscarius TaxID=2231603 RepID=A0A9W8QCD2_AKAMU|nr:hypothetical protein LMH87_009696 [Akanthomyces muscarius]KAJ4153196.1 hypothetical protein LMH87_009696 [Akanthomyces muscarius]